MNLSGRLQQRALVGDRQGSEFEFLRIEQLNLAIYLAFL